MTLLDMTDYDPSKMGGTRLPVGEYHFSIMDVDPREGQTREKTISENGVEKVVEVAEDIKITLEVAAAADNDLIGATTSVFFPKGGRGLGKTLMLLCATGITTQEELEKMKADGKNPDWDLNSLCGRSFIGKMEENEWQGKKSVKLGFGIYAVDDPKVAHVPKNAALIGDQMAKANADDDPFGDTD